jgi:AGCS family alanine or glycine:cation symporter
MPTIGVAAAAGFDITQTLESIASRIWSLPMLALLLGTGVWLTLRLSFLPQRWLPAAVKMLFVEGGGRPGRRLSAKPSSPRRQPVWRRLASALTPTLPAQPGTVSALAERHAGALAERHAGALGPGDISSFQALMTALAATVGTGNIVGVATAIALGGPGAVFWMWATAVVGSATKFSEAVLAMTYRHAVPGGGHAGGPMYYIRDGLPRALAWMAAPFALFCAVAAFGIGNLVQANAVSHALETSFGIPLVASGVVAASLVAAVTLGGIRRIGRVAAVVVPSMMVAYLVASAVALWIARAQLPSAFGMIFRHAFSPAAARGGFAGATVALAVRTGVARGLLSNEAGLGSSPIAHAAARSDQPVEQGMVAMLGTFIDTLVVGTATALVILTSGAWAQGLDGARLSAAAFRAALPGPGDLVVSVSLVFFAFTTILGWSYYGERAISYLFGERAVTPYRWAWALAVFVGSVSAVRAVWAAADIMNGLMALPNLLALLLLSGTVARAAQEYRSGRLRAAAASGGGGGCGGGDSG